MKLDVMTLDGGSAGQVELDPAIFDREPSADVLHRVVRWQLTRRRAGTHKVKTRSEVSYSTKKIYRQKGTGGARHGARSAPIFRKGGVYKGPTPRSYEHNLPKKVRALGLKMALSAKAAKGKIVVIDEAVLADGKTKTLKSQLDKFDWGRAIVIDGAEVDANFLRAAQNLPNMDILPTMGANVYDIMKRDTLVITRAGLEGLAARFAPKVPQVEEQAA